MRDPRAMPPAILASLLVHLAVVAITRLPAASAAGATTTPPEAAATDAWSGDTPTLPGAGDGTYDVEVDNRGEAVAAQHPVPISPATPPAAPQVEAPKPREEAPKPIAASKAPAEAPEEPADERPRSPDKARAAREPPAPPSKATPAAAAGGAPPRAGDDGAAPSPGGGEAGGARGDFGVAGARSVRSLGRAFTRAIPPACQADPAWGALSPGDASAARFTLDIDHDGHITSWKPDAPAPPRHLESLMKRTIALLGAGTFAVGSGAVTAGRQTIEIRAAVSDVPAAADADAAVDLAWRFEGGAGAASFTQAGGRHVEISLRVVRTEIAPAPPPD